MKSSEIFEKKVKQVLQPKLFLLGFERIRIKGDWFAPKFLYEHNDIWLGASWDWRDHYLEIDMGRLFLFKDVLPRVIVIGTIAINDIQARELKAIDEYEIYFQEMFTRVNADLEERIRLFESEFAEAFARKTTAGPGASKKERKYQRIFLEHLGKPIKRADLPYE